MIMFERFVEIICNYVEVEASDVQMESRFIEDLGFTSFDFMTMLGDLEDEFDIEIDQTEVANVRTVGEALEYMKDLGAK
jgi:acyl carrier protein